MEFLLVIIVFAASALLVNAVILAVIVASIHAMSGA
jgi:hypothetical protein